jgi:hypothetical protein
MPLRLPLYPVLAALAALPAVAQAQDADPDVSAPSEEAQAPHDGSLPSDNGGEVRTEESAILPNAEDHLESEAETADLDCEADPDNCLDPLESQVEGPALSSPDDVGTSEVETREAAPVVAEPGD